MQTRLKDISGKINICFFVGSLQTGGAENHVLRILENIDRDKYNPYVCVFLKKGQYLQDLEKLDIPIKEYNFRRFNIAAFVFHQIYFIRFLIKARIHLIHMHLVGCFRFALTGALLAGVANKVITWHNIYPPTRLSFFNPLIFANRFSDKIIAVSEKVKECNCVGYGVAVDKVQVVYNGISPEPFEHLNNGKLNSNTKEPSRFTIGIVGSLVEQKGHTFLLDAMARLKSSIPGVQLLVVGDGPLKKKLKEQVERNGIQEQVRFLGIRNDIPELLKSFDIWVMPSLYEGFSIALLEAMASELPIIATDVGGNSEAIIDQDSGLMVPAENVGAIAGAIEHLYSHPAERKRLAANARKRFGKEFTASTMSSRLDRLYSSMSRRQSVNVEKQKYLTALRKTNAGILD